MTVQVAQLNPAFRAQERRQMSSPIENDRRSGIDRRQTNKTVFTPINKLKNNIDRLDKSTLDTQQVLLYALSPIPTARRVSSLPDTIEKRDYTRAGLLAGMAAASFPGDFREMGLAGKEFKNIFRKGVSALNINPYQHESAFLKGTVLESLPIKFNWLDKIDKTLFDTKLGGFLQKTLNIKIDYTDMGEIKNIGSKSASTFGYKFTGNSLQRVLGRALLRTPVLGLAASCALEIPALTRSVKKEGSFFDKTRSFTNQLCKSVGYIGLVNSGIALVGAALFPYGYIAALIGMGIGGSLGLIASKQLNKKIDKVIKV